MGHYQNELNLPSFDCHAPSCSHQPSSAASSTRSCPISIEPPHHRCAKRHRLSRQVHRSRSFSRGSPGSGAGIGSIFGSMLIAYARNPSMKQQLFSFAILGFALSEAMGLFCLLVAFLILFAL